MEDWTGVKEIPDLQLPRGCKEQPKNCSILRIPVHLLRYARVKLRRSSFFRAPRFTIPFIIHLLAAKFRHDPRAFGFSL